MSDVAPFNPLDKSNLGKSISDAILGHIPETLGELAEFRGAGVYALYYIGKKLPFNTYEPITNLNRNGQFDAPIYVGKAVPEGARKGTGSWAAYRGKTLHNRLKEHAESVGQARNLDLEDFYCRFLVLDDVWIPLGESLLIARFLPIWNKWLDGFGNHDPGKRRKDQKRSRWDVVHPGRPWVEKLGQRDETAEQIVSELRAHVRNGLA